MKQLIATAMLVLALSSCVTDEHAKVKVNATGMTGDLYVNQLMNRESRSNSPGGGVLLAGAKTAGTRSESTPLVYRQSSGGSSKGATTSSSSASVGGGTKTTRVSTTTSSTQGTMHVSQDAMMIPGQRKIRLFEGQKVDIPHDAIPIATGVVERWVGQEKGSVIMTTIRPGFEHLYDTTPESKTTTTTTTTVKETTEGD